MCPSSSTKAPPADSSESITDARQSAKDAGLRYVYDTRPGITRRRTARGFRYLGPGGEPVRDPATLARIRSIVIPPAWVDVWICSSANGHLQATGRDARGRKQSRYHPRWREVRDEAKYEHMIAFAAALPAIRRQVEDDLALPGLPRDKVLATIVRLLETTFIRVGNPEYARDNQSFGLTTLRRRHVTIRGALLTFHFHGKSGVEHNIDITDRRLAKIVRTCRDTPGYELFQYLDGDGVHRTIDATDVNDYLHTITGDHFTAKDFRTWAGTVLACGLLQEIGAFTSETEAKKNVVNAIKAVAERLGNTPSVCRKCYVHPAVLESYLSGTMIEGVRKLVKQKPSLVRKAARLSSALQPEETALLQLLQRQIAAAS